MALYLALDILRCLHLHGVNSDDKRRECSGHGLPASDHVGRGKHLEQLLFQYGVQLGQQAGLLIAPPFLQVKSYSRLVVEMPDGVFFGRKNHRG